MMLNDYYTVVMLFQYYENDDPAYFQNKIQYTLTEDITDAELFYTDSADDVKQITTA